MQPLGRGKCHKKKIGYNCVVPGGSSPGIDTFGIYTGWSKQQKNNRHTGNSSRTC